MGFFRSSWTQPRLFVRRNREIWGRNILKPPVEGLRDPLPAEMQPSSTRMRVFRLGSEEPADWVNPRIQFLTNAIENSSIPTEDEASFLYIAGRDEEKCRVDLWTATVEQQDVHGYKESVQEALRMWLLPDSSSRSIRSSSIIVSRLRSLQPSQNEVCTPLPRGHGCSQPRGHWRAAE